MADSIHQLLVNIANIYNLQEKYVDDADPCMGILSAAAFAVRSTYQNTKGKSPGQKDFLGHDSPHNSLSKLEIYMSSQIDANR